METISIEEAYKISRDYENDRLSLIESGKLNMSSVADFLSSNLQTEAIYHAVVKNDPEYANKLFYKSALVNKYLLVSFPNLYRLNFMGVYNLLLSNNTELYEYIGNYSLDKEIKNHFMYRQNSALIGLMNGNDAQIEESFRGMYADTNKGKFKRYRGIYIALEGVFNNNPIRVIEGISLNVDNIKVRGKSEDPLPLKYLDLVSIAILRLASFKGMEIDYDHKLVPQNLTKFKEVRQIPEPKYSFLSQLTDSFEYIS